MYREKNMVGIYLLAEYFVKNDIIREIINQKQEFTKKESNFKKQIYKSNVVDFRLILKNYIMFLRDTLTSQTNWLRNYHLCFQARHI